MSVGSTPAWERFQSQCLGFGVGVVRVGFQGDLGYGGAVDAVSDELRSELSERATELFEAEGSKVTLAGGTIAVLISRESHWVGYALLAGSGDDIEQRVGMIRAVADECAHSSKRLEESRRVTERLSLSFEEVTTLFRMAGVVSNSGDVNETVLQIADEIHRGLPYEWVAVTIYPLDAMAVGGVSEMSIQGMLPCSMPVLESFVEMALPRISHDKTAVLVGEECDGVAPRSGEVVGSSLVVDGRVIGAVFAGERAGTTSGAEVGDVMVVEAGCSMLSAMLGASWLRSEQERMFLATVQTVVAAIEAKDPYTCGHAARVGLLSEQLAIAIGWSDHEAHRARLAGIFHDVGKVGISDDVIRAPGKLSDAQYEQMKLHPEIGHHILSGLPGMGDILPAVLYHHERVDGRGYPRGLSGERIPMIAKIVCLVDAFDAMSSNRHYRSKLTREQVFEELEKCSGTQFDAKLVRAFIDRVDLSEFDRMIEMPEQFAKTALIIEKAQAYFTQEEEGKRAA